MKSPKGILIVLAVGLAAVTGCSSSSSENTPPPAKAAKQMQNVFAKAPPAVKQNVAVAADAMKQNQYEKAFVALQTVQSQHLTYEQALSTRESMHAMQAQLARAVVEHDPNAIKAAQAIRAMQPQ
jgi:hypothetical protein